MADTTTYLSGERIQGRSDDGVTTNSTVTYTGDMLGDWTGTSGYASAYTVDAVNEEWDLVDNYANTSAAGALKNVALNLSAIETVSTSAWCLRFTIQTTGTASGDNPVWWIGLSDAANSQSGHVSGSGGVQVDYLGFGFQVGNGGTELRPYQSMCNDDLLAASELQARLQLGGSNVGLVSNNTKYYCQVVRDGSNFNCKVFSDSGFSTLLCERSNAVTVDEALTHLVLVNYSQGSGVTGTVGAFQFFNGATGATTTTAKDKSTITDVPVGTRYEETDTRKIFRSYETDADGDWEDGTFGSPWTTDSGDDCTIANGGITVLPNSNDYDGMTFDLQSASGINTTVNSSAWVWQFTIDQIAFSNNGACDYRSGFVMLSSVAGRSGDHVIFHIENTNCGFQASGYRFCIKNSGNHDGGQESESSSRHFKPASNAMITASTTQGSSSDGKIGIRITRTASDAFKFQVYNDPTFAGTPTTDVNTTSTSICGDCTALRYVQVGGYKQGNASGSSEFVIDDMKFWNGVTTPTQTIAWKEKGTA